MEGLLSFLLFATFFYFMMRFGCGAHMIHGHGGHGSHQDRASQQSSATDPVCGMPVVPNEGYTKTHAGQTYHFCSRKCLDAFEANPDKYQIAA
jgi:YHS domain-containing protein